MSQIIFQGPSFEMTLKSKDFVIVIVLQKIFNTETFGHSVSGPTN